MKIHNPSKVDSCLTIDGKNYVIKAGETAQVSDVDGGKILKVHQFLVKGTEVPVVEKVVSKAKIEEETEVEEVVVEEVVEVVKEKKSKK